MRTHALLPAPAELDALRQELRRSADGLRRVARQLRATPPLPRADDAAPTRLCFVRGGLWDARS